MDISQELWWTLWIHRIGRSKSASGMKLTKAPHTSVRSERSSRAYARPAAGRPIADWLTNRSCGSAPSSREVASSYLARDARAAVTRDRSLPSTSSSAWGTTASSGTSLVSGARRPKTLSESLLVVFRPDHAPRAATASPRRVIASAFASVLKWGENQNCAAHCRMLSAAVG
jgi:hypothetical protein